VDLTKRAALGPTLALSVALSIGAFMLAAPLAMALIEPTVLAPPFGEQNQDAETLLFVLAFAVFLPASLIVGPRLADRIAAGPNAGALPGLAGALCAGLLAALLFAKASERLPWEGGLAVLAFAGAVWMLVAATMLGVAVSDRRSPALAALGERVGLAWPAAAVLAIPLALTFADLGSITILPLGLGLIAAGVAIFVVRRGVPDLPRGAGIAVDVLVPILIVLTVPNLVLFSFENPAIATDSSILQFHQNFFLGPANHVIGGDAMLVDTFSQYGVGSIAFLAGVFEVVPIGNGTLGLIEGALASVVFVLGYGVMRLAGVSRGLAASAMALSVFVLVLSLEYRLGGLLQHGAIRFGLPIGVLFAAVLAVRRPGFATAARIGGLGVVGVSSIWALEAFGYTLLTVAALIAFGAATEPVGERRAWLLRRAGEVVLACLVAHLVFALATLAGTGELPEWAAYLDTLREFLTGGIGDLTYDFTEWSPAFGVGAFYLASAAALVLVVRRTPELVSRERLTLLALAGTTAYGVALFSYFVNRSADHILPYICLPAVMTATLWISLLRREAPLAAPTRIASALAAAVAVLLVAVAWSGAGSRFEESPIALAAPGGDSLNGALERLWDRPPLKPGAEEGERLLIEDMPGENESLVLTDADLGVEVLVRSGRINRVPLSDPWEDSLVPDQHIEEIEETVAGLESGDRVLLDAGALEIFERYLDEPGRDALTEPFTTAEVVPAGIALLTEVTLQRIGERFDLEEVERGSDGLVVAELVER